MSDDNITIHSRLLAWEKLRVVYNVVMLIMGIPVAFSIYHNVNALGEELTQSLELSYSPICVLLLSLIFGLAANVMYMLGPALEIYIVEFSRVRFGGIHRSIVFILGLLASLALQGVIWLDFALIGLALMD